MAGSLESLLERDRGVDTLLGSLCLGCRIQCSSKGRQGGLTASFAVHRKTSVHTGHVCTTLISKKIYRNIDVFAEDNTAVSGLAVTAGAEGVFHS